MLGTVIKNKDEVAAILTIAAATLSAGAFQPTVGGNSPSEEIDVILEIFDIIRDSLEVKRQSELSAR
jgi:hypothetical protein